MQLILDIKSFLAGVIAGYNRSSILYVLRVTLHSRFFYFFWIPANKLINRTGSALCKQKNTNTTDLP